MKIGIIGCGNMGSAVLESVLSLKEVDCKKVIVSEIDKKKLVEIKKKCSVITTSSNIELVKFADVIILAIKPQQFKDVLNEIKILKQVQNNRHPLIISIAAGIKIEFIEKILGNNIPIVRTMPNLPLKIGYGITAICFNSSCKTRIAKYKNVVKKIFSVKGKVIEVKEELMDLITAISGSGPAYIFYISEIIQKVAQRYGLEKKLAEELVNQTILGAGKMLATSKITAEQLRQNVTSKGGTTEQAMSVFYSENLEKIFEKAILAAKNRAEELSNKIFLKTKNNRTTSHKKR